MSPDTLSQCQNIVENMSKKRTLDSFFQPSSQKKARKEAVPEQTLDIECKSTEPPSTHATYPFPVSHFPSNIANALSEVPAVDGKEINDQLDLDLLYFEPYIPRSIEKDLFEFLRQELFFYRVVYKISRGGVETQINTPR